MQSIDIGKGTSSNSVYYSDIVKLCEYFVKLHFVSFPFRLFGKNVHTVLVKLYPICVRWLCYYTFVVILSL